MSLCDDILSEKPQTVYLFFHNNKTKTCLYFSWLAYYGGVTADIIVEHAQAGQTYNIADLLPTISILITTLAINFAKCSLLWDKQKWMNARCPLVSKTKNTSNC